MEFKDYVGILKRRWPILLLGVALTLGSGVALTVLWSEPVFEAETKIYLESQRAADMIAAKLVGEFRGIHISPAARLALAGSETVLDLASNVLRGKETQFPELGNTLFSALSASERSALHRSYSHINTEYILERLEIKHDSNLQIGRIRVTAPSRTEAIHVVNAVTLALKVMVRKISEETTVQAKEDLEERLQQARTRLSEKEASLKELRIALALPSSTKGLEEEIHSLISSKEALRNQRDEASVALAEQRARYDRAVGDPEAFRGQAPLSDRVQQLRLRLGERERRIEDLKERYKEEHPEVNRLQLRLEQDRERLKQMVEEEEGLWLDEELLPTMKQQLERQEALVQTLEQRIEEKESQLKAFSSKTDEYELAHGDMIELEEQTAALGDLLRDLRLKQFLLPDPVPLEKLASRAKDKGKKVTETMGFVFIISLLIGIAVAYFAEFLDDRVHTPYYVKRYLNLPILSTIPKIRRREDLNLLQRVAKDPLSEIYGHFGAVVASACKRQEQKVLMICSAAAQEGKTTICGNLAVTLARSGYRVAVVDADMRRPRLQDFFGSVDRPGLSEYLEGIVEARAILERIQSDEESVPPESEELPPSPQEPSEGSEALPPSEEPRDEEPEGPLEPGDLRAMEKLGEEPPPELPSPTPAMEPLEDILWQSSVPNLFVILSGRPPANPGRILRSQRMRVLTTTLTTEFDFVLLDTPPLESTVDPLAVAHAADGALLVVSAGTTRRHKAVWAKRILEDVDIMIQGVVMNRLRVETTSYYYYYKGEKHLEKGK